MSLDFILIKSHGHPLSLEDIDMDLAFKEEDYRSLAERFFNGIAWSGNDGFVIMDDMSFELRPSDVSLSVTARGAGDTVAFMDNLAVLGAQQGVVIVDVQGSEILVPAGD
ncbi:hypothetical protein EJO66_32260 [Variovorax beijingensis]|uniref:Uncharacterized protein n=1 Tax=Variovorax beijingensis TaxID=2496117 RepID=A0ABX9ZXB4_9BURK|nr:hypothetical protein [Variovorax beijingensis]RSZ24069.1 hypothetical protein EJO66_32260 [Variovorax beijingensis]